MVQVIILIVHDEMMIHGDNQRGFLSLLVGAVLVAHEPLSRCSGLSGQGRGHCDAQKDCAWCLHRDNPSLGECYSVQEATEIQKVKPGFMICDATNGQLGRVVFMHRQTPQWLDRLFRSAVVHAGKPL